MLLDRGPNDEPRVRNYYWVRERPSDELEWIRADAVEPVGWKRPIVLVSGGFDLLHCGHMRLLFAAREKAGNGTVLCAMESDRLVRASHGPGRPILGWIERATSVSYMPINYLVEVDSREELDQLVATVEPDLYICGNNYNEYPSKFPGLRRAFIRSAGMHTTELVRRCVESYGATKYR